jgi:hypothetical protein
MEDDAGYSVLLDRLFVEEGFRMLKRKKGEGEKSGNVWEKALGGDRG